MKHRSNCPIARTLDILGDKWSLLVLRDSLVFDCRTFGDFASSDEHIPTNILSDRLKRLEAHGLLTRHPYQQNPERFEYRPTDQARAILPILKAIRDYGERYH